MYQSLFLTTMSNAQETVISTLELLELTLSHLPMRDLLVTAPLVSKTWQAITLTPALQRALFFQPDPESSAPRIQNALLAELFPPFFELAALDWSGWAWQDAVTIQEMPWSMAPDAFRRAEASWRRMLVCQPPARRMTVIERDGEIERSGRVDLDGSEPLRMDVLYDLVLRLVNGGDVQFCVWWDTTRKSHAEHMDRDCELGEIGLALMSTVSCHVGEGRA
ncbi:hypothetical protein B0H14DRAFT_1110496 [Mycena olivaceomarginata]|nr:hypothetical protein B0H14DRAFT_1110496 [Mycena olivaceomarginata]